MDWHKKKKAARNVSRTTRIVILLVIGYWLYTQYKPETKANPQKQMAYNDSSHLQKSSIIKNTVTPKADTVKKLPQQDSLPALAMRKDSSAAGKQDSASPVSLHPEDLYSHNTKNENRMTALHGPSALFSSVCNVAIGKTVPVNILWEGDDGTAASFKLITIKVDDIADQKAKFTIEDPFNVLLFSQTGYAADDKIIIRDEKHDLSISVAEVTARSAVVNVVSRLDENIVSRLQKVY